jgi:hypothetical protein
MEPKTIKKWRDKLGELLDRARTVAQSGSLDERLSLADELQNFIIDNPSSLPEQPETAEFDEMDRIARAVHDGLLVDAMNERIAAVMTQTAELAGLTKKIQAQTALNEKSARTLRLETAQKLIVSVTGTVAAIKDLKAQVEGQTASDEDLTALSKKLGSALSALQDLRDVVESSA